MRNLLKITTLVLGAWLTGALALAQQLEDSGPSVLAGHSMHGEVFNEGPRQRAYLMGGTGKIDFPVTTGHAAAQEFFNQGVGQLHGFWYFEAERSFRQVAAIDPDCAMAYWGMAMANVENAGRAKGFIQKAVQKKKSASRREQLYIDGLAAYLQGSRDKNQKQNYIKSLETIIHENPDDIEAKAFLVVRLWQFKSDLPIVSHQAVDALLDQVFAVNPMHPAHHYRIHLWDGVKGERALGSAARCGQSAPTIAHQWHMSGHIYSGLQRYADAAWEQEASSRADHAHMIRDRVLPDQIHNYPHNQEWLVRNLSHIGRANDAVALAKNLVELPRHPRYNTLNKLGRSASYGRQRLFDVLERYERWDELIELCHSMYLEPTDLAVEQIKRLRALGVAHAMKGEVEKLQQQLAALEKYLEGPEKDQATAEPAPEPKQKGKDEEKGKDEAPPEQPEAKPGPPAKGKAAPKAAAPKGNYFLDNALSELRGYQALFAGDKKTALELFQKTKGLSKSRQAQLFALAGDQAKAEELARQGAAAARNQVVPQAVLVDLLFRGGKKQEAAAAFEQLRQISADIDSLDGPVFQRLAPLAQALNLPADWRLPRTPAKDLGERPPLDQLGPFRWHPPAAPGWTLPDASGKSVSLSQYKGRPVVVIFYLGYGCLHCVEQLKLFAPKTRDFADAGISLVAVSSDTLADLKKSHEKFKVSGDFPFPLVSDARLEVFKAYRAFDDFENQPLHGTFLIDGQGLIRWHDISFEPFADPDFLLAEAKRLLRLPVR
jgi:peroxiredoxin